MFSMPLDATLADIEINFSATVFWLSILAAFIGSFTALSCNARVGENSLISKNIWLFFASISMGLGIWSMHFIGMTAIDIPVSMSHNLFWTFVSIFPAILSSLLAFYFVNQPRKNIKLYLLAGLTMGIGISLMHYIGMAGMELEGVAFYYESAIFALSIAVAITVSFVALYVFSNAQTYMIRILVRVATSIVLGIAVASMHYTGMYAMKFYVGEGGHLSHGVHSHDVMNTAIVTAGISISMVLIVILLMLTTIADTYLGKRVSEFDTLTKLPNRRMFQKWFETKPKARAVAIWHFHDIEAYNQEHGYLFIDRFIHHVAQILIQHQPPLTELYRTEGNRFTYVAKDEAARNELEQNIMKLSSIFKEEFIFEGRQIMLQGVCAFAPAEQTEPLKKLYLNALAVLNHPAIEYKLGITYYNPKFHTRNFTDEILEDFEEAMDQHHLFLVYQPKITHGENKVESVEALIRWQHPNHGFLSPAIFLPILEANDRMADLTDWIIVQVCKEIVVWQQHHFMPEQVAINIPGPYLTSSRLMDVLQKAITSFNISPSSIELEITETSFVKTIASAEKIVHELREKGFSVALDDFGTGVSSLSYLKKIPISTLKIDKSFVDDVPASDKDASILVSMIQLGKSLKMNVVVEGVETKEQVDFLVKQCAAPSMQGFYFAKPMHAQELQTWCEHYMSEARTGVLKN